MSKKIIKLNKNNILYMILFTGVFSDILRIPNTSITAYRILILIGFFISVSMSVSEATKGIFIVVCLLCFNIIQCIIFTNYYNVIEFIPDHLFLYEYFYLCIGITVIMVYSMYKKNIQAFLITFKKFIYFCSNFIFFVFCLYYIFGMEMMNSFFTNPNDYGVSLAAVFPMVCVDAVNGKRKCLYIFALLIMLLEYLNDCKLCCIAILVEIFVLGLLFGNRYGKTLVMKVLSKIIVAGVLLFIVLIITSNATVLGVPISDLLLDPINRIIKLDFYPTSNSSGMFRVNVFIMGIMWIFKSALIGMGAGSATMLTKNYLASYSVYETTYIGLSLHNSWMEFLLDFGFVALIIEAKVFLFGLKGICQFTKKQFYIPAIVVAISIWFFGMQSSGSYTNYGLIMILTYYYLCNKSLSKKKDILSNCYQDDCNYRLEER